MLLGWDSELGAHTRAPEDLLWIDGFYVDLAAEIHEATYVLPSYIKPLGWENPTAPGPSSRVCLGVVIVIWLQFQYRSLGGPCGTLRAIRLSRRWLSP